MNTAIVTRTNETNSAPRRRYEAGDVVTGPEADRLVSLGLAEYDDTEEESEPAAANADATTDPESKES